MNSTSFAEIFHRVKQLDCYRALPCKVSNSILIYDKQALGKRVFKKTAKLAPSGLLIEIETRIAWEQLDQVRIIPRGSSYVIEVVYQQEIKQAGVDPHLIAAIDLGVDQLAAITSNKPGFQPRLYNGQPLKDLNHYYNQQRAQLQSLVSRSGRDPDI